MKQKSSLEINLSAIETRCKVARKNARKGQDVSDTVRDILQRAELLPGLVRRGQR